MACAVLTAWCGAAAAQQPDWTRPYIGAQIGHSWDRADLSVTPAPGLSDRSFGGLIGGVQAGKGFLVVPGVLVGIVADVNWLDASTSAAAASSTTQVVDVCNDGCLVTTTTDTLTRLTLDVEWKASVRGKLSYLVTPTFAVFATAGVAFAQLDAHALRSTTVTAPPPVVTTSASISDSSVLTGFVVGVGGEIMVTPSIGAFWQVSHYEFETQHIRLLGTRIDADLSETTMQVGLNLYLN